MQNTWKSQQAHYDEEHLTSKIQGLGRQNKGGNTGRTNKKSAKDEEAETRKQSFTEYVWHM